jgi:transmembrane sensor
VPERDDSDAVGEAAAAWFLRLRAIGAQAEEYERFAEWLAADPTHRTAYAEVEAAWQRMGALAPRRAGLAHALARRQLLRRAPAMAAVGLGGAGAVWLLGNRAEPENRLRTAAGQQAETVFPDGTRLVLDAASVVECAERPGLRQATLLAGQLVVQVPSDPGGRPFELAVAGTHGLRLRTTAAGTLAAKRIGEGGRVAVLAASGPAEAWAEAGGTRVALGAGMALASGPAEAGTPPRAFDPDSVTGWQWGHLVYRDVMLGEVVEDLARHRGGWILLVDDALRRLRVTAALDAADPDGALAALAAALPIHVHRLPRLAVLRLA